MAEIGYQIYQNSNIENLSKSLEEIDFFYYGDSECEFNFLASLRNLKLFEKLKQLNKKLVLVTPHMSEKSIQYFQNFLTHKSPEFLNNFYEIVINDFGILHLLQNHNQTNNLEFIFGNYLFNQRKDPLLKYSQNELIPTSVVNINLKLYKKYLEKNSFTAIELYNSFGDFTINNLDSIKKHLYYPYVVYATSRHCYRSLIDEGKEKLQIVDSCTGCHNKEHIAFSQKIDEDLSVFSRGNKYFYKNMDSKKFSKVDRIIYNDDIIHS